MNSVFDDRLLDDEMERDQYVPRGRQSREEGMANARAVLAECKERWKERDGLTR